MSYITEFELPNGETVLVESADPPIPSGEVRASIETIGKYLDRETESEPAKLEQRFSPIVAALQTVRGKLATITDVDEVELQAGVKFVGEAGVILSKVGTEASISIKLKWKRG
jgi:hypothetical protein